MKTVGVGVVLRHWQYSRINGGWMRVAFKKERPSRSERAFINL